MGSPLRKTDATEGGGARTVSALLALGILAMLSSSEALAQYRIAAEPSIEIAQVHDDNLFFSFRQPARDRILRVRPGIDLHLESPRWLAVGSYGFDSERFADHSNLTNSRARQHGLVSVHYRVDPRLTIAMDGRYTDTDTPGELNLVTGLATSRVQVRQLDFGPSARYRISPRLTAYASVLSSKMDLVGGLGMRSMSEAAGIEQRVTPRDMFTADYEHVKYLFDQAADANTNVLKGGWTHALSRTTRVMLQAGPRLTNHSLAPELLVSLTHDWQSTSVAISALQTQTTVVGSAGTVQARSLQARFTYRATASLSAYAAPSVARSVNRNQQATVYRIGLGAHYAITPLSGFDVTYSHDSQHGVFDPLQANGAISRSLLSAGFTARWSAPDWFGTGRR